MNPGISAALIAILSTVVTAVVAYLVSRWKGKDNLNIQRYTDDTKVRQEFTAELQRELDRQRALNIEQTGRMEQYQKLLSDAKDTIVDWTIKYAKLEVLHENTVRDLANAMKQMGKEQGALGQHMEDALPGGKDAIMKP